eukprot:scaffold261827_cov25-Prasinocladus_malaysianus.AAC.1
MMRFRSVHSFPFTGECQSGFRLRQVARNVGMLIIDCVRIAHSANETQQQNCILFSRARNASMTMLMRVLLTVLMSIQHCAR